jgi:hypothetical protein
VKKDEDMELDVDMNGDKESDGVWASDQTEVRLWHNGQDAPD